MCLSQDMAGRSSSNGTEQVKRYLFTSQPLAIYLQEMFRVAFPEYFENYAKAFQAGQWYAEDPGPWLGRAIVWKLQVDTHIDGLDDGPTAIFCCGDFEGGSLYVPDLKFKHRSELIILV